MEETRSWVNGCCNISACIAITVYEEQLETKILKGDRKCCYPLSRTAAIMVLKALVLHPPVCGGLFHYVVSPNFILIPTVTILWPTLTYIRL